MMGSKLRDMIRSIRACKTASEERAYVAKECAALRTAFTSSDDDHKQRNIVKLMFIHILGYPTHFGQMECVKLIATTGYPEKRIGYLGLMLLLDEKQEILMLVTNSVKKYPTSISFIKIAGGETHKIGPSFSLCLFSLNHNLNFLSDLQHSNQFIVGLALCALGNICTAEMARDLAPEVEKLLHHQSSYIRKKATLCSVRIVRKVQDLVEYFITPIASLTADKHHGVLLTSMQLMIELCQSSTLALDHFRKQTTIIVRILKTLVTSGYAPEYDIHGIPDPFLQIRILKLLGLLGKGDADCSDDMSDILAQVATNTDSSKNAGNAILYECVKTIIVIEAIGGLRVLAVNIMGKFLSSQDNNIRYVALNTLVAVVAVDNQAVQRHRTMIVECVKDSDISIRRRALDLVYALVNKSNILILAEELLNYLHISDFEFQSDLTSKIGSLIQRFAPSKQWYIDHMIQLMVEAGSYVSEEVVRGLIVVITNAPHLHEYVVMALYKAFQHWNGQESLANVTLWCVGEYGDMLVSQSNNQSYDDLLKVTEQDVVNVIEATINDKRTTSTTSAYAIITLLKLSLRFQTVTRQIRELIKRFKGSIILELQQRAVEFDTILEKHVALKAILVEKIPIIDETTYSSKQAYINEYVGIADRSSSTSNVGTDVLSETSNPMYIHSSQSNEQSIPLQNEPLTSTLLDLVGSGGVNKASSSNTGSSILAYESETLKINFEFTKTAENPSELTIKAIFTNLTTTPFIDFAFQAAVPKFVQMQLLSPSSNVLPTNDFGSIQQNILLNNTLQGQKALMMKFKITYSKNGEEILEQGQVNNFPIDL